MVKQSDETWFHRARTTAWNLATWQPFDSPFYLILLHCNCVGQVLSQLLHLAIESINKSLSGSVPSSASRRHVHPVLKWQEIPSEKESGIVHFLSIFNPSRGWRPLMRFPFILFPHFLIFLSLRSWFFNPPVAPGYWSTILDASKQKRNPWLKWRPRVVPEMLRSCVIFTDKKKMPPRPSFNSLLLCHGFVSGCLQTDPRTLCPETRKEEAEKDSP